MCCDADFALPVLTSFLSRFGMCMLGLAVPVGVEVVSNGIAEVSSLACLGLMGWLRVLATAGQFLALHVSVHAG